MHTLTTHTHTHHYNVFFYYWYIYTTGFLEDAECLPQALDEGKKTLGDRHSGNKDSVKAASRSVESRALSDRVLRHWGRVCDPVPPRLDRPN
jgi:hypothetical protein